MIASELNVKKVSFTNEEEKWVRLTAKANAKVLGPKLGPKMKVVLQKIKELPHEEVARFEKEGKVQIESEWVSCDDVVIDRAPKQEGLIQSSAGVTVWFDTRLTDILIEEGLSRELVNRIQKLRKDLGFEVTNRIEVGVSGDESLLKAFKSFEKYICEEVLANQLLERTTEEPGFHEQDIDGKRIKLWVSKAPH